MPLIPRHERPDLRTRDDVLGYLQRRALPDSEALALKHRIIPDLVERSRRYKFALLDRVLEESRFWDVLARHHEQSGKPPTSPHACGGGTRGCMSDGADDTRTRLRLRDAGES